MNAVWLQKVDLDFLESKAESGDTDRFSVS